MPPKLVLAPAASGKTLKCLHAIRRVAQETPLARICVVLPDRNQSSAFNRRLALEGGALGVQIGTFRDLYLELLALDGRAVPLAPDPLVHRLTRAAISALRPSLKHYEPIAWRPGFVQAVSDVIAELKRALITPEQFERAVSDSGPRLAELALIYKDYQARLKELDWADDEGAGWLAVEALEENAALPAEWRLLVVDGFDSFNPVHLRILQLLSTRVDELMITLSGDSEMKRPVFRRFARTLDQLKDKLAPEIELVSPRQGDVPALAHLEGCLFEQDARERDACTGVFWAEAQTTRLEAREALRWLKARIVRDGAPPEECAVIARDLESYRPFLKEAAVEFGLPLRFLGGEPLEKNPAVAALLGLLGLAPKWPRRPLVDAVRTPYFNLEPWGLCRADAALLNQVARYGQVIEGLDQWREALDKLAGARPEAMDEPDQDERLPAPPRGDAERLLKALSEFAGRGQPPEKGTIAALVDWVQELAFGSHGLDMLGKAQAQEDTSARDLEALIALAQTLQALVLAESVADPRRELSWDEFLGELRGAIQSVTYNADDPRTWGQGRVYAGNLNTTRGIPYRAAAVLGLSEGLFPAPVAEDPFLSDDDRTSLARLGLPLEPRARSDQQTQFYEAITRANQYLLLTRPYLADDGEAWEPSPYWTATRALFTPESENLLRVRVDESRPLGEAASALEVLALAARAGHLPSSFADLQTQWASVCAGGEVLRSKLARKGDGQFEGLADRIAGSLADKYGPGHIWSASGLKKYGTCPFYFYLESALDLELLEPPEEGFDLAQLGSILHKILEKVYQCSPKTSNVDAVLSLLPGVAQEILTSAPRIYGFRPTPLWAVQQKELLETLNNTISELAEQADGFWPFKYEQKYGIDSLPLVVETAAGDIRLRGIIDRVDRNEEGELRIIDYKTGSTHFSPSDLIEGRRLQLPLYAAAAETGLGLGQVVDGFYWRINKARPSALRLSRFSHTLESGEELRGTHGATQLAALHIGSDVGGIRAGQFIPSPPSGGCPKYCPGRLSCWRYSPCDY